MSYGGGASSLAKAGAMPKKSKRTSVSRVMQIPPLVIPAKAGIQ